MDLRRSRAVQLTIVTLTVGLFLGAAHATVTALIDSQNRRQLRELNELILRRAELGVDYGFIALGDLVEQGVSGCDTAALGDLRRQVYQRSTVKDIRVVDRAGGFLCSAFPETLEFDSGRMMPDRALAARNSQVRLFRLDQQSGAALGVLWEVISEISLVAVVSVDALLFDMVPAELRDHSEVMVKLENGDLITALSPGAALAAAVAFTTESERYPLVSILRIDAAALARWQDEPWRIGLGIGAALGLAFGLLLVRAIRRPATALTEIDDALAAGEFQPFMQPIFTLKSGDIVGCEVLARWFRKDGTIVPPARFIPLAEAHGRIVPLARQIVSRALAELQPLLQRDKTFKVAFNIVPSHLVSDGFVDEFRRLVYAARVSPRQVVIELTERQELHDLAHAARVIAELREYGFKVAIDDAGTGHSGLSYIQSLGVSTIKIDKFFVDSIGKDHAARAVVEMLVALAHELGMTTVAEGIESEQQIRALADCGVDEGQGFVVSPPLPLDQFMALLHARTEKAVPGAGRVKERAARVA